MSLLDDIKAHYESEHYPPEDGDLDQEFVDGKWVPKDTDTEQISYEVIDDSPRWGDVIQVVYRRGDELVAVRDVRPATEDQDWGDYGDPEIYPVESYEVTITKFRKV